MHPIVKTRSFVRSFFCLAYVHNLTSLEQKKRPFEKSQALVSVHFNECLKKNLGFMHSYVYLCSILVVAQGVSARHTGHVLEALLPQGELK